MNEPAHWVWTLLGIPPTDDEVEIREAYARRVKDNRPDEKPEQFQLLKKAFDTARSWAIEKKRLNRNSGISAQVSAGDQTIFGVPKRKESVRKKYSTSPVQLSLFFFLDVQRAPDTSSSAYELERFTENIKRKLQKIYYGSNYTEFWLEFFELVDHVNPDCRDQAWNILLKYFHRWCERSIFLARRSSDGLGQIIRDDYSSEACLTFVAIQQCVARYPFLLDVARLSNQLDLPRATDLAKICAAACPRDDDGRFRLFPFFTQLQRIDPAYLLAVYQGDSRMISYGYKAMHSRFPLPSWSPIALVFPFFASSLMGLRLDGFLSSTLFFAFCVGFLKSDSEPYRYLAISILPVYLIHALRIALFWRRMLMLDLLDKQFIASSFEDREQGFRFVKEAKINDAGPPAL